MAASAQKQKVTEVHAPLDMKRAADESLWVVKVPRFLMEHLQTKAGTGASIGTVRRAAASPSGASSSSSSVRGPAPAPSAAYTLTLPETVDLPEGVPREYDFNFSATPPATYIFSRGDAATDGPCAAPRHEGRVAARGEVRPRMLTAEYKRLVKERGDKADAPRRTMGIVDDDRALKREKLNHRQVRADEKRAGQRKAELRERNANKRQRPQLSARELKDALKACFVRQPYWARRDLATELGNADLLSTCLDELCVRVTKKGDVHYGDYQLKDHLRTGLPAAAGAGSGAPLP